MKKINGLIMLLLMSIPTSTLGQTSQEYALMGHKLWAAFQCAALANVAGNAKEGQRLFDIGYKQGRIFIEAVQTSKVERQHINTEVPVAVVLLLHGPTADFILGRIFEAASDVTNDVFKSANGDEKVKKIIAQSKYTQLNCSLM